MAKSTNLSSLFKPDSLHNRGESAAIWQSVYIGELCKGSTTDSGSVCRGSNPCSPATHIHSGGSWPSPGSLGSGRIRCSLGISLCICYHLVTISYRKGGAGMAAIEVKCPHCGLVYQATDAQQTEMAAGNETCPQCLKTGKQGGRPIAGGESIPGEYWRKSE